MIRAWVTDLGHLPVIAVVAASALGGCGVGAPNVGAGGIGGTGGSGGAGGARAGPLILEVAVELVRLVQEVGGEIPVRIDRAPGVEGTVEVEVLGLPPGVGATSIRLEPNETAGSIPVSVLATALQGGPTPITIEAALEGDLMVTDEVSVSLYIAGRRGSPDRSFGTDGVYEALGVRTTRAGLDQDGSIVLAGNTWPAPSRAWISRLSPNGEVDASFGANGVIADFIGGMNSGASALYMRGGGRFLFVGRFSDVGTPTPFARAFLPDGSVDTGYGTGGDVLLSPAFTRFVARRNDGFVLATTDDAFAFDGGGAAVVYGPPSFVGNPQFAADDGSGRIMMAGSYTDGDERGVELTRLTIDGELDDGFGFMGAARAFATSGSEEFVFLSGLTIAPSGKGVAFGSVGPPTDTKRAVYLSFEVDAFVNRQVDVLLPEGGLNEVAIGADDTVYYSARDGQDGNRQVIRAVPHNSTLVDASFGTGGEVRLPPMTVFAMLIDERTGRLYVVGQSADGDAARVVRLWL